MPTRPRPAMPSEFDLIRRHFTRPTRHTDLAVGDDAALLQARPGMQLAVATARKLAVDLWRLATKQTTPETLHLLVPTA